MHLKVQKGLANLAVKPLSVIFETTWCWGDIPGWKKTKLTSLR